MTVGAQTAHQVDLEADRAAMARVFDLRDALQLVNDNPGDGACAQEQLVSQQHERALHAPLETGDQLHAVCLRQGAE